MADDAAEGVIDTEGSTPSVNWTQLAATFVGAIVLGWIYGVVAFIDFMRRGITNGFARATLWVSNDLVPEWFAGITGGIQTSFNEVETFLESLGPAAPVGAMIMVAFIAVVMILTLQRALEIIVGVI